MLYRRINRADVSVSQFGIGCMRLPVLENKSINEPEAIAMIRHAIDSGVNYVDTAYGYHNGQSESLVGKALQDGYRGRTLVATKLPMWNVHKPEDFERILNEQLTRLGTETVDFYLFHSLDAESWQKVLDMKLLDRMEKAIQQGKVRFPCFSFHDSLPVYKRIIDAYPWVHAQVMFNYVDINHQAGLEGINYAYARGIDTVVMEPLRGGVLTQGVPSAVQEIFDSSPTRWAPVDWAMRWVYDHEPVKVALSGVSTMEQLKGQLKIAQDAAAGGLTPEQRETIKKATLAFKASFGVPCTGCRYCVPCPNGVAIPDIFAAYNRFKTYDDEDAVRTAYAQLKAEGSDASACVECGACEARCPQHIAIIQKLKDVDKEMNALLG